MKIGKVNLKAIIIAFFLEFVFSMVTGVVILFLLAFFTTRVFGQTTAYADTLYNSLVFQVILLGLGFLYTFLSGIICAKICRENELFNSVLLGILQVIVYALVIAVLGFTPEHIYLEILDMILVLPLTIMGAFVYVKLNAQAHTR